MKRRQRMSRDKRRDMEGCQVVSCGLRLTGPSPVDFGGIHPLAKDQHDAPSSSMASAKESLR